MIEEDNDVFFKNIIDNTLTRKMKPECEDIIYPFVFDLAIGLLIIKKKLFPCVYIILFKQQIIC